MTDDDPSSLIFRSRYTSLLWGYACPLRDGETPQQALQRVLDHLLDLLPILGKPTSFHITGTDGARVALRELRDLPTAEWQQAIRRAIPPSPKLEAWGGLVLVLESADGTSHAKLVNQNSYAVEYTEDEGFTGPLPAAIFIDLGIGFDVYDPPPPDASPLLVEQSARNRPKLERFLTAVRDDFDAVFTYRDYDEVGPLGVLGPDDSREGLPEI